MKKLALFSVIGLMATVMLFCSCKSDNTPQCWNMNVKIVINGEELSNNTWLFWGTGAEANAELAKRFDNAINAGDSTGSQKSRVAIGKSQNDCKCE